MPYNSVISRTDAASLIPTEISHDILKTVAEKNPLLQLSRRLPNMPRKVKTMPVLTALATAYFVNGDTGMKQTTNMTWGNKSIEAEELAVIVPIPESVLDDADYDIWSEVKPSIVEALDSAIIQAVLYGTNIPATWTVNMGCAGLLAGATAASQVISLANFTDAYEAILTENGVGSKGLFMLLEEDGFTASGNLAATSVRGLLRNVRDANGNPIFKTGMQSITQYELEGTPLYFPTDGSIDENQGLIVSGQWNQLVYAMRQDLTYKILDQAVIQDGAGNIIYNLAQQDMVALRAVMRLGFALPNPMNRMNVVEATRFPFSVLTA